MTEEDLNHWKAAANRCMEILDELRPHKERIPTLLGNGADEAKWPPGKHWLAAFIDNYEKLREEANAAAVAPKGEPSIQELRATLDAVWKHLHRRRDSMAPSLENLDLDYCIMAAQESVTAAKMALFPHGLEEKRVATRAKMKATLGANHAD